MSTAHTAQELESARSVEPEKTDEPVNTDIRLGDVRINDQVFLASSGGWERRTHAEMVWGTAVTFDVRAENFNEDNWNAELQAACAYLHQVDAWFSTYRADTPVTMYRNNLIELSRTPRVVRDVLAECAIAKTISRGAFDPWAVKGGVDPSGYVKGWAAGQVADRLRDAGYANVCVNASGDIACHGCQAPGQPWAIGILNPYDTQAIVKVVSVTDGAVATSGLYERGSHITNPHLGTTNVYYDSATIVGPDPGLADALATAALVAGPACAEWFTDLPQWSVYLIKDSQAQFFGPAFESAPASLT